MHVCVRVCQRSRACDRVCVKHLIRSCFDVDVVGGVAACFQLVWSCLVVATMWLMLIIGIAIRKLFNSRLSQLLALHARYHNCSLISTHA